MCVLQIHSEEYYESHWHVFPPRQKFPELAYFLDPSNPAGMILPKQLYHPNNLGLAFPDQNNTCRGYNRMF